MTEMAVYKEIIKLESWADKNFRSISSVTKSISENLMHQKRLNRKLVIFSVIMAAYSIMENREIREQAQRIRNLEKRIDELELKK